MAVSVEVRKSAISLCIRLPLRLAPFSKIHGRSFSIVDTDSEIAFGIENEARPPKKLAERVEQTTEDLRIQKLRNRNIFELSGGEKQKIAFASVYAMNPRLYYWMNHHLIWI